MDMKEQRDKLLVAVKPLMSAWDSLCDRLGYEPNHLVEIAECRTAIAQIEAEIARERKPFKIQTKGIGEFSLSGDQFSSLIYESISPRVQIIRRAKILIEALNLPDGGGVAYDKTRWYVYLRRPEIRETGIWPAGTFYHLPSTALDPWPIDWKTSWITRDTSETEEV